MSNEDDKMINETTDFWAKIKKENDARDKGQHQKSDAEITKEAKAYSERRAGEQEKLEKAGLTQAQQRGESGESDGRKKPSEIRQGRREQNKEKKKSRNR